VYLEGC